MADYRLTSGTSVIRADDGASIPNDPANRDWAAYQSWLAAGNTPDAYAAPPAPPVAFTPPQIIAALEGWGVADQVLAAATPLLLAKFYTARVIQETDERLTSMLTSIGKTIADLEAAVAPA